MVPTPPPPPSCMGLWTVQSLRSGRPEEKAGCKAGQKGPEGGGNELWKGPSRTVGGQHLYHATGILASWTQKPGCDTI